MIECSSESKLLHPIDHWEYQSFLRQFRAKNLFFKANISPRNSSVTISLEKYWFLWHFVITRCLCMQTVFHLSTMIETAWQNLSDELLILSCGLWRKHRIENKLSVNNLNPYGECLERLLRSKAARSWNYVSIQVNLIDTIIVLTYVLYLRRILDGLIQLPPWDELASEVYNKWYLLTNFFSFECVWKLMVILWVTQGWFYCNCDLIKRPRKRTLTLSRELS